MSTDCKVTFAPFECVETDVDHNITKGMMYWISDQQFGKAPNKKRLLGLPYLEDKHFRCNEYCADNESMMTVEINKGTTPEHAGTPCNVTKVPDGDIEIPLKPNAGSPCTWAVGPILQHKPVTPGQGGGGGFGGIGFIGSSFSMGGGPVSGGSPFGPIRPARPEIVVNIWEKPDTSGGSCYIRFYAYYGQIKLISASADWGESCTNAEWLIMRDSRLPITFPVSACCKGGTAEHDWSITIKSLVPPVGTKDPLKGHMLLQYLYCAVELQDEPGICCDPTGSTDCEIKLRSECEGFYVHPADECGLNDCRYACCYDEDPDNYNTGNSCGDLTLQECFDLTGEVGDWHYGEKCDDHQCPTDVNPYGACWITNIITSETFCFKTLEEECQPDPEPEPPYTHTPMWNENFTFVWDGAGTECP